MSGIAQTKIARFINIPFFPQRLPIFLPVSDVVPWPCLVNLPFGCACIRGTHADVTPGTTYAIGEQLSTEPGPNTLGACDSDQAVTSRILLCLWVWSQLVCYRCLSSMHSLTLLTGPARRWNEHIHTHQQGSWGSCPCAHRFSLDASSYSPQVHVSGGQVTQDSSPRWGTHIRIVDESKPDSNECTAAGSVRSQV